MIYTKKILITITFAGISMLYAGNISINESNINKETIDHKDNKAKIEKENIKKAYIKKDFSINKKSKKRIKQKLILNTLKLRYLSKINQIEQCVLISENKEDLNICNQRIHNLSRDINKISNRYKKRNSKNKKRFKNNF